MKTRRVILAHGWNDGSTNQWLNWLAGELTRTGYEVVQPVFSHVHVPRPRQWVRELAVAAGELDDQTVIVGYSLGVPVVLRFLHDYEPDVRLAGLILVAGFGDGLAGRPAALFDPPLNWERLKGRADKRICFYGDNDYLVAPKRSQELARNLEAREVLVVGGGHLIGMPVWPGSLKQFPAVLSAIEDCYTGNLGRWWYDVRLWMKRIFGKN
jgi:predicted alpha/beta hydrolase family esterase